jgi:Polysaccharide biosynthesis/export protein
MLQSNNKQSHTEASEGKELRMESLSIRKMSESGPRWTRIRNLGFTFILAMLTCAALAVQRGHAQGAGQSSSAGSSAPSSSPGDSTQAPSAGDTQGPSASQTQAPSAAGNGAQGPDQNSGAQDASPEAPAQSDAAKAPAGSGGAQAPSPNSPSPATGANSTPTEADTQNRQSEPQDIQQPNPYKNLPSLHDLYTQIPASGGTLQRFGSNSFIVGTGNANELPMDLPAGPDYVLGPGDALIVNIWGGQSSRLSRTIDRQGQIDLPEAGTVMISGMTIAEAQTAIQQALNMQFNNEHVEISMCSGPAPMTSALYRHH